MSGAETLHVDHIKIRTVRANNVVRVVRALSGRVFFSGWHWWSQRRSGLGAVCGIVTESITALITVVGRALAILIVRLSRIGAERVSVWRIYGLRFASRCYQKQGNNADHF